MKPALLIIPKIPGSINSHVYLAVCIDKMIADGFCVSPKNFGIDN